MCSPWMNQNRPSPLRFGSLSSTISSMRQTKRSAAWWVVPGVLCWTVVASAAPDARTLRTWKAKCASCHGEDGKGATDQGRKMAVEDLTTSKWQRRFTDAQIRSVITTGFKRTSKAGVAQEMDAYDLPAEQVDALLGLLRSLGPAEVAAPEPKAEAKPEPKAEAKPEPKAEPKPEPKPEPKAEPKPDAKKADKPKADAKAAEAERKRAEAAIAGAATEQFLVPAGAFASAEKVQELVDKLRAEGLPHFTERITTSKGERTRVRVGPFPSKAAADKAVEQLKGMGLAPGKVVRRP